MKRNYIFKNKGRISLAIGLLATTLLSSCLKDKSPGALNLGTSPALVGWQYYGFAATPISTKIHGAADDNTLVKVTLSAASVTLGSAVTVSIADDPSDAQAYAAAQTAAGDSTNVLPTSQYTITSTQITIPAGQQYATVKVNFKGNVIDFNKKWVLGLKITSANGAIVASNLNVAILALTLQSPYEGDYSDNGYTLRLGDPVLTGYHTGVDQQMATVNATTVGYTIVWSTGVPAGGVAPVFLTVNPATNKVTITSGSNATLTNAPGYDSRYDPAAKKFYISITWSTPGNRGTTDTLTYKGPL